MRKKKVGILQINQSFVDITDPFYYHNDYGRLNDVPIDAGNYVCYIWQQLETDMHTRKRTYSRIGCLTIVKEGLPICPANELTKIGSISVDCGLAGIFLNKPDFSNTEWEIFCNLTEGNDPYHILRHVHRFPDEREGAWLTADGFFSESGLGDGRYAVLGRQCHTYNMYDEIDIVF